jgi:hypothetical protein
VASSAAQRGGKESDAPDENRDFPALWAQRFLAAVKNTARPALNLMKMSRIFIHACVRGDDGFATKRMSCACVRRAPLGKRLDPDVLRRV